MPTYDFRCNDCNQNVTLFYKSYRDYDNATPTCSNCQSTNLTRIITGVNIGRSHNSHDYTKMDAQQMLSVLESGDSRAVGEMMKQVGEGTSKSKLGEDYVNAADALSHGQSLSSVERDLRNKQLGTSSDEPLPKPKATKKPPKTD